MGESTFENFEVDLYNQNAYNTAKEFIDKPMRKGMMLAIFGLEGTGKTRLLKAIVNHYEKKNPETVVFISGKELFQELEDAIKRKDFLILALKRKVKKAEVVCIDGVSELLTDEKIKPWFMRWFHHCKQKCKRIIYTHDCEERLYCAIQELSVLDERATFVGIPKTGQNRNLEVVKVIE